MMFVGAAVLFVALAACQADAQEYDLSDCRTNQIAPYTHHADDANKCLVFYNCDNAHGGKRTWCPAGTIYNPSVGLCLGSGNCLKWKNDADCLNRPNNRQNFSGIFCDTYYEYDCASQSFIFGKCPRGQFFDGQICSFGAPVQQGCVRNYNTAPPLPANSCKAAHLEYVDQCTFREGDYIKHCPLGTFMDPSSCRCVLDPTGICGADCQMKYVYDSIRRVFNKVNSNMPATLENLVKDRRLLHRLEGSDLGHPPTTLRIKFSLKNNFPSATILKTENKTCVNLQMNVKMPSANEIRVTLKTKGLDVVLQGVFGGVFINRPLALASGNQDITLKLVFSGRQMRVTGSAARGQAIPITLQNIGSQIQSNVAFSPCLYTIGTPEAEVKEFALWQNCTNVPL